MYEVANIAPSGSTGNNTHTGYRASTSYEVAAFQFVVEVVGGTPTVTWKIQGSLDSTTGSDGNWYDLAYITDASDTLAVASLVSTAVGAKVIFISNPVARRYGWFRVVTGSNTNVTYRTELYRMEEGA